MNERIITGGDGISFECSRRTCRIKVTIREGSFFKGVRLTLCNTMLLMHLWSKNYSEKLIIEDYNFSKKTLVDWFRFFRELCVEFFENLNSKIGGPDTIVELDETLVVKRKNNVGRMLSDGWLFGGIERREDGSFKCFVKLVYSRDADTLIPIIQNNILPGTHIMTDGWAAYSAIDNPKPSPYIHDIVIHEHNYINPSNTLIHTQKIEATWSSLKRFLRSHGTNKGAFIYEYILEWMFRRKFENVFDALIEIIKSKYQFI